MQPCAPRGTRAAANVPWLRSVKHAGSEKPPDERSAYLLIQAWDGQLLLEKRPPVGIWGGLWSPPVSEELPPGVEAEATLIRHAFTHFRLNLTPVLLDTAPSTPAVMDNGGLRWCDAQAARELGLPGPVRKFVDAYFAGNIQWQKPFTA